MNNATTTQNHPIRNTFIAVALAAAVAVPVTAVAVGGQQALATNGDNATTTALVTAEANDATYEDYEYMNMTNEEYVDSLVGLTDAEKQELLALYDKLDALADDEDLSDAEWLRMGVLQDKAWYAEMEEYINSDTSITDEQRASYLQQLKQMKELDEYFDAYFNDPTYLEKCDQYDAIYDSFNDYLGWSDYDDFDYSSFDVA